MKQAILVGLTGSIACYKTCDIIRLLRKKGYSVTPVMTKEANAFITPLTLQTVSANKVFSDMFAGANEWDPCHIALAQRADLVLIAPATANIIGKLAHGICDDLLTCVTVSTKAPVLVAPAMNGNMYKNPIVQDNIARLKRAGFRFVGPAKGDLACGTADIGRLAEPEKIVAEAMKALKKHDRC
ncbi:MAG: flavoprotein [Candidatus Omnitrophota bacterium]